MDGDDKWINEQIGKTKQATNGLNLILFLKHILTYREIILKSLLCFGKIGKGGLRQMLNFIEFVLFVDLTFTPCKYLTHF